MTAVDHLAPRAGCSGDNLGPHVGAADAIAFAAGNAAAHQFQLDGDRPGQRQPASLSASGRIELQDVRAGIGDKEVGPSGRRAGGDTVMISATSTGSSSGSGGVGEDGGMPDAISPVDLAGLAAGGNHPGALWRLDGEDLQANLVRLGRGDRIEPHRNDEVDVLVVVVLGRGELTLDGQVHQLAPMVVAHLPKGTVRAVEPVDGPLVYLSVHRHRSAGLQVGRPPQRR